MNLHWLIIKKKNITSNAAKIRKKWIRAKNCKIKYILCIQRPNSFEPWSEDLYQRLEKNIFDLTQEVKFIMDKKE